MKGGAALALVGALILALGLKGTWQDVYKAAIGQYHGIADTTGGVTGNSGKTGKVLGCSSIAPDGADIPVPASGVCPAGYTPVYAKAGGGGAFRPYVLGLSPGSALPTYAGSGVKQNGWV